MRCPLLIVCSVAAALAAEPVLRHNFEDNESGWTAFGENGVLRITHETPDVKNGKGALAFDYTVGKSLSIALLPMQDRSLAGMKSLRFWLKTDSPTAIAVAMNEKPPGGHYTAIAWSPGNVWQRVELTPADFNLNEGPNEPQDPDGKLDLDQLQAIGLVDLHQLFSAAPPNPNLPIAIDARPGKHTFFLDDFEVSSEPVDRKTAEGPGISIDDFAAPQLRWVTPGDADLRPEREGMRVDYRQVEDHYIAIFRALPRMDLRKQTRLAFDIASDRPAQLVFSLEERLPGKGQGPRYNVTVDVLGGGKVDHRAVAFSAFEQDGNGVQDSNGKLDLDNLKTLSILDITAASSHETAKNSIWLSNLRAVEK